MLTLFLVLFSLLFIPFLLCFLNRNLLIISRIHSIMAYGVIRCLKNQDRILFIRELRHLHSIFHIFSSDIVYPAIRRRFNDKRCRISVHSRAVRLIFTHGRKSFTHKTTTYTHGRKSFTHKATTYTRERNLSTHKNTSERTLHKPEVLHFTNDIAAP